MRLYDGGACILIGILIGVLISGAIQDPKGEIETKEPVKEEVYDKGLYKNGQ